MSKVNLDALLPREDFISHGIKDQKQNQPTRLELVHLLPEPTVNYSSIYHLLKKPDFQRETNEWDTKRIANLIESFIDGSFIPSIILWQNQETNKIYVIDGAHRLSAIIAYINDDYGDGKISREYYKYNEIPSAEVELARKTKAYIDKNIGSFNEVMKEGGTKAANLKLGGFDIQIIRGDVKKAEDSFFKINQQGVVINTTEKELCKTRGFPLSIATRSIVKGAAGAQYWENFEASYQTRIKEVSEELNTLLFKPPYNEESRSVILDHPLGGNSITGIPVVFDMLKIIRATYKNNIEETEKDTKGEATLEYLNLARKLIWRTFSEQPGSLGIFPSVYFYNIGGKFIESAFLGFLQLLAENEQQLGAFLPKFTKVRKRLEMFLVEHKVFITQINRKFGSKDKSYRHMKGFFYNLIEFISTDINVPEEELLKQLKIKYDFLNEDENEIEGLKANRFGKQQKKAIGNQEELHNMTRCKICGGYLHPLSRSFDHHVDKKFGGSSENSNSRTTHFYCNNSKDKLIALGIYRPVEGGNQ
jgi:hypothetical protein